MIDVPFAYGYTVIDFDGQVLIEEGDTARQFPLASVTKLLGAYGVLLACDRGLLSLDQPLGPEGATLRHVLAHASGLAMDQEQGASRVAARRIYSNQGYDVLGQALQAAVGEQPGAWITRELLQPLGMTATAIPGSLAHSGISTVQDLSIFAEELMRPQLLSAENAVAMTSVQYPKLAGILPGYGRQDPNPWGLGPEIRGDKSPHWTPPAASSHTFGHFGQSGSFLWVDPDAHTAGIFLGAEPFGQWHKDNWPSLPVPTAPGQ